jgi:hypothetical protein
MALYITKNKLSIQTSFWRSYLSIPERIRELKARAGTYAAKVLQLGLKIKQNQGH